MSSTGSRPSPSIPRRNTDAMTSGRPQTGSGQPTPAFDTGIFGETRATSSSRPNGAKRGHAPPSRLDNRPMLSLATPKDERRDLARARARARARASTTGDVSLTSTDSRPCLAEARTTSPSATYYESDDNGLTAEETAILRRHHITEDPFGRAPWASPEAFTPVGPDKAFTPPSMIDGRDYFDGGHHGIDAIVNEPHDQTPDRTPARNPEVSQHHRGPEGRPVNERHTGARANVASREHYSSRPAVQASRSRSNTVSQRDQPLRFATRPPGGRDQSRVSPHHPRPGKQLSTQSTSFTRSRAKSMLSARTTSSLTSFKNGTTKAFAKAKDGASNLQAKLAATVASDDNNPATPTTTGRRKTEYSLLPSVPLYSPSPRRRQEAAAARYTQPVSLAEHALNQPEPGPADPDYEFSLDELKSMSPASTEHLWRHLNCTGDPRQRAASISFTARQLVSNTKEARAQAALKKRDDAEDADEEEHRRAQLARLEEYILEQKDHAEQMALQSPDRYPGLQRRR
ncbi:hypothetical protein DL764_005854 [Monosporascus ibericus]|uniref:Uncharacterized protein n=1 Tax=Monosporascus ibericus TaxID=155417 RepID=A0A4Q4T7G2_9PEZI|nr:hypothetical protein DL764_005854 [Monosporascus ibericus]